MFSCSVDIAALCSCDLDRVYLTYDRGSQPVERVPESIGIPGGM